MAKQDEFASVCISFPSFLSACCCVLSRWLLGGRCSAVLICKLLAMNIKACWLTVSQVKKLMKSQKCIPRKNYASSRAALSNIDLNVNKGARILILIESHEMSGVRQCNKITWTTTERGLIKTKVNTCLSHACCSIYDRFMANKQRRGNNQSKQEFLEKQNAEISFVFTYVQQFLSNVIFFFLHEIIR